MSPSPSDRSANGVDAPCQSSSSPPNASRTSRQAGERLLRPIGGEGGGDSPLGAADAAVATASEIRIGIDKLVRAGGIGAERCCVGGIGALLHWAGGSCCRESGL